MKKEELNYNLKKKHSNPFYFSIFYTNTKTSNEFISKLDFLTNALFPDTSTSYLSLLIDLEG